MINGQLYNLHHTATAAGYISRKVPEKLEEYKGRFGIGYKVHRPALTPQTIIMLIIILRRLHHESFSCL